MAAGEKTEKATPKRRRDERKKGNVLMSRDVVAVATLFASYVTLRIGLPLMAEAMAALVRFCIGLVGSLPTGGASAIGTELKAQSMMALARSVALPLLITILAAVAATFAQTRLLVSFEALRPKFSRLNPLQGIKRLFSLKSIIEAFKGVLKIAILLFLIYRFVEGALLKFAQYMNMDLARSIQSMLELGLGLLLEVAAAFLVISFLITCTNGGNLSDSSKCPNRRLKRNTSRWKATRRLKGKLKSCSEEWRVRA